MSERLGYEAESTDGYVTTPVYGTIASGDGNVSGGYSMDDKYGDSTRRLHGVCRTGRALLIPVRRFFTLCPQVVPPNPACPAPRPRGMAGLGAFILSLILTVLPVQAIETTDALGRQVSVTTPVRRIVALNSDALEILRTLRAQDRIVGVYSEIDREPAFWGTLTALPKIGGWRTPNLEAIADLAPDLVLTYSRNPGEAFDRKMAALGIPVLRLEQRLPGR